MIENLRAARDSVAGKLAAAREQHSRAAYESVTGKDKAAAKRVTELASQVAGFEAELRTIEGAISFRDLTKSKEIEEDLAQRVTRLVALGVELEESTAR